MMILILSFDTIYLDMDESGLRKCYWKDFHGDVEEITSPNAIEAVRKWLICR